jgi:hypothetical protein
MNSYHPIALPKPIKVSAPKIASVHIAKQGGQFQVHHVMTQAPHFKKFTFADPAKMMSHLKRIQSSQWREPDRNEGPAIAKTLDLGT